MIGIDIWTCTATQHEGSWISSVFAGKSMLIAFSTSPWREAPSFDGSLSLQKMLKSFRCSSASLMFLLSQVSVRHDIGI